MCIPRKVFGMHRETSEQISEQEYSLHSECKSGKTKGQDVRCGNDLLSQMYILPTNPHMRADMHRQCRNGPFQSLQRRKTIQTPGLQAWWPMVRHSASLIRGLFQLQWDCLHIQRHGYSGAIVWTALTMFQSLEPERMDMKEFMF